MAGALDDLKAAGFTDDEVSKFGSEKRQALLSGGFSTQEADAYLGQSSNPSASQGNRSLALTVGNALNRAWSTVKTLAPVGDEKASPGAPSYLSPATAETARTEVGKTLQTVKDVGSIYGPIETALHAVTAVGLGFPARIVGSIAGLSNKYLMNGNVDPDQLASTMQELFTYHPQSDAGRRLSATLGQPFQWFGEKAEEAGHGVTDIATGAGASVDAAAAAGAVTSQTIQMIAPILGVSLMRRMAGYSPNAQDIRNTAQIIADETHKPTPSEQMKAVRPMPQGEPRAAASVVDTIEKRLTATYEHTGIDPISVLEDAKKNPAIAQELMVEVYHGSPHEFTSFDLGKIGAGEGAQSYGHGLYFAESPEVAQHYTGDQGRKVIKQGDKYAVQNADGEVIKDGVFDTRAEAQAAAGKGLLYKVQIPERIMGSMLDWDKPLSEQAPAVQEALAKLDGITVEQYQELARLDPEKFNQTAGDWIKPKIERGDSHSRMLLSDDLSKAGITGIRYLDQASRENRFAVNRGNKANDTSYFTNEAAATAELEELKSSGYPNATLEKPTGTHNIVLFNEQNARVIERNGQKVEPNPNQTAEDAGVPPSYAKLLNSTNGAPTVAEFSAKLAVDNPKMNIFMTDHPGATIELNMFELRDLAGDANKGYGRTALQDITRYADMVQRDMMLTATPAEGSHLTLDQTAAFYEKNGFYKAEDQPYTNAYIMFRDAIKKEEAPSVEQTIRDRIRDEPSTESAESIRTRIRDEGPSAVGPEGTKPNSAGGIPAAEGAPAAAQVASHDPWETDPHVNAAAPALRPPPAKLTINDAPLRDVLQSMAQHEAGWAQIGGMLDLGRLAADGLLDEHGNPTKLGTVAFTEWIPRAEWWRDRPDGLSAGKVQEAVRKALAGEKLKAAERRTVDYMTEVANQRLAEEQAMGHDRWNEVGRELVAEGMDPTTANIVDADAVARAGAKDPDLVERMAIEHETDDAAFMDAIRRINGEEGEVESAGAAVGRQPTGDSGTEAGSAERGRTGSENVPEPAGQPAGEGTQSAIAEAAPSGGKSLGQQVRELALDELRSKGWNTDWPFILADLGNSSFREAIKRDPELSAAEKEHILSFAPSGKNYIGLSARDVLDLEPHERAKPPSEATLAARGPESPYGDLVNLNLGITPGDMAKSMGAIGDAARAIIARADKTKIGHAAINWTRSIVEDVQLAATPMAAGSDGARAIAKDYANAERVARRQWSKFDEILKDNYSKEEREAMWNAAEEENVLRTMAIPEAERGGRGLAALSPEQRATMDTLQRYGDALLQRARDVGMFKGEGVEYWTPRVVALIGEDGEVTLPKGGATGNPAYMSPQGRNITTSASSLKHRKYLTVEETEAAAKGAFGDTAQVVRDIRVMPYAMARIERAIAGRELINGIKEMGKKTAQELVVEGEAPGYFTVDHPSFKTYRPRMTRVDDKVTPALDQNGDMVFDRVPLYVSEEFKGPLKSVMGDQPGPIYQALMNLKARTMGVIMYSPLIHNAVEWGRAIPVMPGKVLTFRAYFEGNAFKHDEASMNRAVQNGMVPIGARAGFQDITGLLEEPNMNPGRSWTAQLLGGTVGLVNKAAGEAVKSGIDTAGDFWHNTLLWDRVGDLQAGIYKNIETDLIKKGFDPGVAGKLAAHFANRYAGALPNESMSAMARKTANFVFFSRTFTMGNLGVMKDMMTGLPRDVAAQIERDAGTAAAYAAKGVAQKKAVAAFAMDIALMYGANAALQSGLAYMKNREGLGEILEGYRTRMQAALARTRESPMELLNTFGVLDQMSPLGENEPGKERRVLYDYDHQGTGIYVRLPTGKIGEEFIDWSTSPLDILKRKEGTLMRPLIQMITNDKGYGRKVYDEEAPGFDGAAKALGNILMNFVYQQFPTDSLSAAKRMLEGRGDDVDALKVMGPFFGLTFSKGAPGGPAVGELFKEERRHRTEVSSVMPDVKEMLKAGDTEGAVKKMVSSHMTPAEIRVTLRLAQMPASRLSRSRLKDFLQTASPEARARMQQAMERSQRTGDTGNQE